MSHAWDVFEGWARRVDTRGFRLTVPVLGAGFNAQAGAALSWAELLQATQRSAGIEVALPDKDALVGNTTLAWEAMVLATVIKLSVKRQTKPHQAEKILLDYVSAELQRHYSPDGPTRAFATRFVRYQFRDIISFNFDCVLQVEPVRWPRPPAKQPRTRCYAELKHGTRIWYPHGFVARPNSIQLGVRNYGTYIAELEAARYEYKKHENKVKRQLFPELTGNLGSSQPSTVQQRERLWSETRESTPSWLALAMNAPLVFIGFGMGREEWPVWWFLNQRARNHARRKIERPVFVFMNAEEASRLRVAGGLTNICFLEYGDREEGWQRLLAAFDAATIPDASEG